MPFKEIWVPLVRMAFPHAKIVRDPLSHAFGEVVVNVIRHRTNSRDEDRGEPSQQREPNLVPRHGQIPQPAEPMRKRMAADHVVDDDLDRPWTREAHRRFAAR